MGEFTLSPREKKIIASSPLDVYVASNMPYEYPYKLVKPKNVSPSVIDSADVVMMDSGIGDDISNKGVLDKARKYDCDFVVSKDYLHEQELTTKSIRDFHYQYQNHDYSGDVLIPLQGDHIEHYYEVGEPGKVLIGGIRDFSSQKQVDIVKEFRDEVGYDVYVHGLGMGMSKTFVKAIRNNPRMLDSIDCSTPEQNAINNKISDAELEQNDYITCKGKYSSVMRYRISQLMAIQLNYVMSEFCDMHIYSENKEIGSVFDY